MQRKIYLVLAAIGIMVISAPLQAEGWFQSLFSSNAPGKEQLTSFEKELASPRDRVRAHTTQVKVADDAENPLFKLYEKSWKKRGLGRMADLNDMLDAQWGQGASLPDLYRVLRTRQEKVEKPEDEGIAMLPKHNQKLYKMYYNQSVDQQKKIKPISSKEMPSFLYKRARDGALAEQSAVRRFYRVPSKVHAGLGALFGGLAIGGSFSMKKFAYDLDWITKYRNVRYQEVLNRFGSVSGDELAAMLLNKEKPLSVADQKLIRQFQLADLSYRTLRAKLWLSVLSAAGGSVGLAATLFAHINRHPVAKWRSVIEGKVAS